MEDSAPPPKFASVSLLDIDEHLVDRPLSLVRRDHLNVDRCVALFNYLVAIGWMAYHGKGPEDLNELVKRPSYFDSSRGEEILGLRQMLEPQIVKFLEAIVVPSAEEASVFFWVGTLQDKDMFSHESPQMQTVRKKTWPYPPRYIKLFDAAGGQGQDTLGVIYDQERRRVAFPYHTKDLKMVIAANQYIWCTLEDLLSNWIYLLRMGKVVLEPREPKAPKKPGEHPERAGAEQKLAPTKLSVWRWCSYGADQVQSTVDAFHLLTARIERCMDPDFLLPEQDKPLVSHAVLDAAGVPDSCFARDFLTRANAPRFTQIAPGLCVPSNAATFIVRQRLTRTRAVKANPKLIPPVLMFYSPDGGRVLPETREGALPQPWQRIGLFKDEDRVDIDRDGPIPAGLYSEAVDRDEVDNAEEGFRLLLPWHSGLFGRYSDSKKISQIAPWSTSELFQHGFQPRGGMGYGRAQRLERLFRHWEMMISHNVWHVGPHGVEGGLETFRDADDGQDWFWWVIEPSW